jgi:quinol monooxygenase YgiN
MAFVQTVSFKTSRIDEMQKLLTEFSEQRGEAQVPGFRGTKLLKDRDNEGSFLVLADFVSYELAMKNSARPDTDAFAKRMAEMSDATPTYGNYDLIQEDAP